MSAPTDLFDLTGKVAVITGGSRGIGKAMAMAFAQQGAEVVIASRKLDACEEAAAEVAEATGRRTLPVACHVGRWDDCDALFETTYAEMGRCDVLVNNAGMSPLYPSLTEITEAYWDKVTAVNLKGPFRLGALFGERMAAEHGGSIINISSIGSVRISPHEAVYASAKAGLNALTLVLAQTYGPNVRSNCVLPGGVLTDISDAWSDEMKEMAARNPLRRAGYAEDFVGVALWLASDASSWVTGETIRVDGGTAAQL